MTYHVPAYDPNASILVVEIGNTTMSVATWHNNTLKTPLSIPTDDEEAFRQAYQGHVEAMPKRQPGATVIGSVVPDALQQVREHVESMQDKKVLIIGETIPYPIDVDVTDKKGIGVDRVCAAAAAYDTLQTECTVVDFGTAVTVDLVDGEGVLLGGAILPGLRTQLRALHESTALLPLVEPGIVKLPYGRDTTQAIQTGVCRGLAGAVRGLVEGYASFLNRWPQVIATGGNLALMAPHCDFLDTLVDHLALRGVGLAYSKHLEALGA